MGGKGKDQGWGRMGTADELTKEELEVYEDMAGR
jgi:hypothetical protein